MYFKINFAATKEDGMHYLMICLGLTLPLITFAQPDYPKGYFRNPLNIPISLSGNFGELRPNHYHMGIDLKTNKQENMPVYAAADGYITKVKIEPGGFGRAIYINHPNGYTTLYAHLNNFNPRLEAYVKAAQYRVESWKLMMDIPSALFKVKKGDFIAYSGNTGGSQAPHLHFEIRRTADDINLNPLLFGLPLKDEVRPRILRLGIYDRTRSVYEQSPKIIPVKPVSDASYITNPRIIKVSSPVISFAVTAFDTHSGSTNLNGIYEADLQVNDKDEESFKMESISYADTRYLNAHIDYRYKTSGGSFLQHLSELPGYLNSIYTNGNGHGVMDIGDGGVYDISIIVSDVKGNAAELKTQVQYDLRPDPVPVPAGKMFYPLMLDGFESENCEFYIGEKCLYDSVHIRHSNTASSDPSVISDKHTIGASYIPLQDSILVMIKPQIPFSEEARNRVVMQWLSGSKSEVQKAQWQHEWGYAKFRDFGTFQLITDLEPPQIIPSGFAGGANLRSALRIVFTVRDNLKTVKNVRAELDSKWLRFTNDKGGAFIYNFDEKCSPGAHQLTIYAEDEAGNKNVKSISFTR